MQTFAQRLDAAIVVRGLSMTAFCDATFPNGSSGRIRTYRCLRGHALPRADELATIAKTLEVSADWLLGLSSEGGVPCEVVINPNAEPTAGKVARPQRRPFGK
jgi:hypothetical protein